MAESLDERFLRLAIALGREVCQAEIEVVGPLLPEEGLAVFEGYTFVSKAVRVQGGR